MFTMSGGYIFKSKLAVGRASFFVLLLQGEGTVKNHRVPTDGILSKSLYPVILC